MSHSHTHAPGESHSHSHSPGPQPQQQAQPQQFNPPALDAKMQALIEADFAPVNVKLGPPNESQALCGEHEKEVCEECGVDYRLMNGLARIFVQNPQLVAPPPPQVIQQQRSLVVNKMKEDGNAKYKAGKTKDAIQVYTTAASFASQRLPWEPNNLMREELSTMLSNRSAAYLADKDIIGSLADAEVVIQIKRPWGKGHYRKGRALFVLGRYEEAKEAAQLGLSYEPTNSELIGLLKEIEAIEQRQEKNKS